MCKPESAVGAPDLEVLKSANRMARIAIEQRQLSERLAHQAHHDLLTGLPNRTRLLEVLEHRIWEARANSAMVAVLSIDLDRFKHINDSLGHASGDRTLIEIAARLESGLVEDESLVARLGSDEFTVVISNLDSEECALRAANRLLDLLRAPYLIDGHEVFVTASMGMSFFPKHGENASVLLRSADWAMYRSKDDGKNDVVCFVPDDRRGMERLELENALRHALKKKELELYYQPIVTIDGDLEGLEVLLAWNHAQRGTLSAKEFIPLAEETGLIVPIGTWVLHAACEQGAKWIRAGLPVKSISVNVSALQFGRPDFVQTVAAALSATGFPAEFLDLELTESLVLSDMEDSIQRTTELRELGVNLTIDDFGTGYSSLNYLRKLPVKGFKIDQSFLRDLQNPGVRWQ